MRPVVVDLRPLQGGDANRGIGSTVRGLAREITAVGCLLWDRRPPPPEAAGRPCSLVRGPSQGRRLSWAVNGLQASRRRPALVHFHAADPASGWAPAAVVTINDTIPWCFPDLYPAGPTGKLRMRLSAQIARRARLVVTPSQASASDVVTYLGVDPGRVRTVPWAADPGWAAPPHHDVEVVAGRLGLPERYLVMAGGFAHVDPRKHYGDAVKALAKLPSEVALVVSGSPGPASRQFDAVVEQAGMTSRVLLIGHLPTTDLAAVFAGAAAFVFPSLREGFGLPLLNAMVLGTPAVVSSGGSLPEVGGDAAVYHEPGDVEQLAESVASVLDDPGLAARLSAQGRARAALYTWGRVADGYRDVYREAGGDI